MAGGQPVRERLPGEAAPDPCGFGCGADEPCFVDMDRVDPEANRVARLYAACGGRERRFWPRPGGIEDQDADVALLFPLIDGEAARADRRAAQTGGAS